MIDWFKNDKVVDTKWKFEILNDVLIVHTPIPKNATRAQEQEVCHTLNQQKGDKFREIFNVKTVIIVAFRT